MNSDSSIRQSCLSRRTLRLDTEYNHTDPPSSNLKLLGADIALALLGYLNRTVPSSDTKNQQTTSRPESEQSHHCESSNYPYEVRLRISTPPLFAPAVPRPVHRISLSTSTSPPVIKKTNIRTSPLPYRSPDQNSVVIVRSFWTLTGPILPRSSSRDTLFILFSQSITDDKEM
ncbi:hypothetical protein CSAL01_03786, partial [Colletotrichum salicis]